MSGNASSGRKRKAEALRVLEGHRGHSRPINIREPHPRATAPEKPVGLGPVASAEWDRIAAEMGGAPGWLTVADRGMLEEAARAYGRWMALEKECDEFGNVFESLTHMDEGGNIVQADDPRARFAKMSRKTNPALIAINRERQAWHKAIIELGLSPTQRSRLVIKQADDEDDDLDSG